MMFQSPQKTHLKKSIKVVVIVEVLNINDPQI